MFQRVHSTTVAGQTFSVRYVERFHFLNFLLLYYYLNSSQDCVTSNSEPSGCCGTAKNGIHVHDCCDKRLSSDQWTNHHPGDLAAFLFGSEVKNRLYWNGQLVWTPALALYLCVGDCIQRDLSPTSGYTGISVRRRYQFWERY